MGSKSDRASRARLYQSPPRREPLTPEEKLRVEWNTRLKREGLQVIKPGQTIGKPGNRKGSRGGYQKRNYGT